jgi:chromosome partitioning protein
MKVISVANQKGGVGKSTIACNLAVSAIIDGKKTLLIDADPQGSSLSFRAIRTTDDLKAVSITQPTIHKDIGDFENFDLVIIDAGGRDNTLFRSAITAASKGILLIPVLPSQYDIWAAEDTFKILAEARVYVDIDAYSVFNQIIHNTIVSKEAKEALEELTSESSINICNSVLYSRIDYKKSISQGLGVIEYSPKSKAAEEICNLYSELKQILQL